MSISKTKHAARRIPKCFYCKEKGHTVADCPHVPGSSSTTACIVLTFVYFNNFFKF